MYRTENAGSGLLREMQKQSGSSGASSNKGGGNKLGNIKSLSSISNKLTSSITVSQRQCKPSAAI